MRDGYRLIEPSDYERAYAVLHALDMAREEPGSTPWEHLVFLHEERVSDEARVPTDELAGDRGFNAEKQRALVLLELLMRGETSVPEEVGAAARQCSSPDCRETTLGVYCPSCELRHG